MLLTTLDHHAKAKELSSRFLPLTQCFVGVAGSSVEVPVEIKLSAMTLINLMFTSTEDIELRFTLRTELVTLGFPNIMKELLAATNEELTIQVRNLMICFAALTCWRRSIHSKRA